MNEQGPDPFEVILNGEAAAELDIQVMEDLARGLVEQRPAELCKEMQFVAGKDETSFLLDCTRFEDLLEPKSTVYMAISSTDRQEPAFVLTFTSDNELVYLAIHNDSQPAQIKEMCQKIAGEPGMHQTAGALVTYIGAIAEIMAKNDEGLPADDEINKLSAQSPLSEHPADAARGLLNQLLGGRAVSTQEFGLDLGDMGTLVITKERCLNLDGTTGEITAIFEELDEPDEKIMIVLDGRDGLIHDYYSDSDGDKSLEVISKREGEPMSNDFEVFDDAGLEEEVAELTKGLDVISADGVETITNALVEANLIEAGLDRSDWAYPELQFGFNFRPGSDLPGLVFASMNALHATAKYMLPEKCPDGFPEQPNYVINERKFQRVDRFMHHKVTAHNKQVSRQVPRYSIVDIESAATNVLDRLAEHNHPVSQMVAQLYNEYWQELGFDTIQQITTEVIKLTHWGKLKDQLVMQTEMWRYGYPVGSVKTAEL